MLFVIYTILAFIAFRAVSSSKHVVDMSMEENTRDIWGRRQPLKKGGASTRPNLGPHLGSPRVVALCRAAVP